MAVGDVWRNAADNLVEQIGEQEATRLYHQAMELDKKYEQDKRKLRKHYEAHARSELAEYFKHVGSLS